jgi:hypothetical protein
MAGDQLLDSIIARANAMTAEASVPPAEGVLSVLDFWSVMPEGRYLCVPTGDLWPAASVDARAQWPMHDGRTVRPSKWLDQHRQADQLTWHPGLPQVIEGQAIVEGGRVSHDGVRAFNMYRPAPTRKHSFGDVLPWRDHLQRLYPEEWQHLEQWLAFKVQRPGDKVNHAIVLGGGQGIGKDTLLEPVKAAVGSWNLCEIGPAQVMGRFNGFMKSVILRISEARDLGDVDRFTFYEHMKPIIAAPPDVVRVDEKNLREYSVANVCGVILTTNHATSGLYLAPDDRRHFVAWSRVERTAFSEQYWSDLWKWYEVGGMERVANHLLSLDISGFNPKAPPPRTEAWHAIVQANADPEECELSDVLEHIGKPEATTIVRICDAAKRMQMFDLAGRLTDRAKRRQVPHMLDRAGYVVVRNPHAADGLHRIEGRRTAIYARQDLSKADQFRAAARYVDMRGAP